MLDEFGIPVSLHDARYKRVGQEGVGEIHLETTTAFHARHRNVGGSNLIGSTLTCYKGMLWTKSGAEVVPWLESSQHAQSTTKGPLLPQIHSLVCLYNGA